MYNTLLRMWKKGTITAAKIQDAVTKGWITQAQCDYILTQPQSN